MQQITELKGLQSTPKKIVITTHSKPDADALGSSLGMYLYLQKQGHDVTVITPTDYPKFLQWMKGNDAVLVYSENTHQKAAELIEKADLVYCLDFSCLDRIGKVGEMVKNTKAKKVLIDHHELPEQFAYFDFWDVTAASTCELVYKLINDLGHRNLICADTADCLYAGIMTDTGSFKHPNVTKEVHLIVAELIELGADTAKVAKLIYDTNSLSRLKFLGFALNERLVVLEEHNVAYFAISADDLQRFNSQTGDTEGLVNYALSIEGITMSAVMIDRGDEIRISFRSVGDFEVSKFANKHFNGGGHKNASGGKSNLSLEETVQNFTAAVALYKKQLNNKTTIEEHV